MPQIHAMRPGPSRGNCRPIPTPRQGVLDRLFDQRAVRTPVGEPDRQPRLVPHVQLLQGPTVAIDDGRDQLDVAAPVRRPP